MEQSTLKYLRVLVPGLIFLLGIYPIYNKYFSKIYEIKTIDFSYLTLVSVIIGSIYYQSDIQNTIGFINRSIIRRNIRIKLFKIANITLNASQKEKVEKEGKFMHIFYYFIDRDESLKQKRAIVYFNGIFLTSTIDSLLITFIFCLLYKYKFTDIERSSDFAFLFFSVSWLSLVLHILSIRKHVKLSNDQLGFIETHYKSEVTQKLNGIL